MATTGGSPNIYLFPVVFPLLCLLLKQTTPLWWGMLINYRLVDRYHNSSYLRKTGVGLLSKLHGISIQLKSL